MILTVNRQESNSRAELLLRTLFGWVYITLPHALVLYFVLIWNAILEFIKFWVVLFTGQIPESIYMFQKKMMQWQIRLTATMYNMVDGYPAIGPGGSSHKATIEFENPRKVSRGLVLVRVLFGSIYVGIPHGIWLYIMGIGAGIVTFIAWWAVLFTGSFPEGMFNYLVRYLRWNSRVALYLGYYTDDYPPFNGNE